MSGDLIRTKGPLEGLRIIEVQGIGPGPFCGMHFADLGAEVIVIERPSSMMQAAAGITRRGKRSIILDLKKPEDLETAKQLIMTADGLIEGNRPGVMERLGLGPDDCLKDNPGLVYGRLTGWGQDGPLAPYAGHDINYAAITGALYHTGDAGTKPLPTPTLLADIGGGAHYLMIGMLAALMQARTTGVGDVVDAAMVDGLSHSLNLLYDIIPTGVMQGDQRGKSLLDGPHWYNAYVCADGQFITVGALEPKFYIELITRLGLGDNPDFQEQFDQKLWPKQAEALAILFKTKTRDAWAGILSETDSCFAPVMTMVEAKDHPHSQARQIFETRHGYTEARPAPRFRSVGVPEVADSVKAGHDTDDILSELQTIRDSL